MTTTTETIATDHRINRCAKAMFENTFPCNPIPFALALADLVEWSRLEPPTE